MSTKATHMSRTLIFILGLLVSVACGAHDGGGYHGGGGYGGGYHGGQGGEYHGNYGGGYYHGGGWGGPSVIIGVPLGGYYGPQPCQNVQVCDPYENTCWMEQQC